MEAATSADLSIDCFDGRADFQCRNLTVNCQDKTVQLAVRAHGNVDLRMTPGLAERANLQIASMPQSSSESHKLEDKDAITNVSSKPSNTTATEIYPKILCRVLEGQNVRVSIESWINSLKRRASKQGDKSDSTSTSESLV